MNVYFKLMFRKHCQKIVKGLGISLMVWEHEVNIFVNNSEKWALGVKNSWTLK